MTKRLALMFVALALIASSVLAHGVGHKKLLGTVKSLKNDHLVVLTKEKKEVTVHLTPKTRLTRGSSVVKRAELKAGTRVSIELESDGTTAVTIKLPPRNSERR